MNMKKTPFNKRKIEKLVRELIVQLGENPDREGLLGTPERMADMYEEIFAGYCMNSELEISFSEEIDSIIAKDIQFYSMCEHHMLPFFGRIHIAYTPSGKVFGILETCAPSRKVLQEIANSRETHKGDCRRDNEDGS